MHVMNMLYIHMYVESICMGSMHDLSSQGRNGNHLCCNVSWSLNELHWNWSPPIGGLHWSVDFCKEYLVGVRNVKFTFLIKYHVSGCHLGRVSAVSQFHVPGSNPTLGSLSADCGFIMVFSKQWHIFENKIAGKSQVANKGCGWLRCSIKRTCN